MKPPTSQRQNLGRWGETAAADYLKQKGYAIIGRNYRTHYGEIDLIARKDDQLVFVEVKTRSSHSLGDPEISVTPRKQKHLIASAQAYMQRNPDCLDNWRVDVIAICRCEGSAEPEIVHFENAIS